jgi:group I intron endonuclease
MIGYFVYCHTNKINGKKYIGITSRKPEKRWNNGNGYKTNVYFYRSIKKYGWHNFQHEILYTDLSKEEASAKEIELIAEYNTCDAKYGYNQSAGGNTLTQNAIKKLSERMSGDKNPWYNKPKHQNNLNATRKAVLCVETGIVYESISQASRMTQINLGHIASTCKGIRKSAGGFHWKYVTVLKEGG